MKGDLLAIASNLLLHMRIALTACALHSLYSFFFYFKLFGLACVCKFGRRFGSRRQPAFVSEVQWLIDVDIFADKSISE